MDNLLNYRNPMSTVNIRDVFRKALGDQPPFRYQERLAVCEELPSMVRVPTGLGKTAAVVLGWIWRRCYGPEEIQKATPRRLAYCLPMRTLVEQTANAAKDWIEKLGQTETIDVHVLMGGERRVDWDIVPERSAILIGTQDMLLSRALNRGYAMSRYRWPMPFGLLHNDCLWVFDEVQLMDAGVTTSTQLEGLRQTLGCSGKTHSIWMSATLKEEWLETVDFPKAKHGWTLELDEEDHSNTFVSRLWTASKPLLKADVAMGDAAASAAVIAQSHRPGTKTLAVFNTVDRATEVFRQLRKNKSIARLVLIHSRFRPDDRAKHLRALLESDDVIAVATQVVEAGVDVSATTLITELAPWASLVQRFGRCNRRGTDQDAEVIWLDPGEIGDDFKFSPPYDLADLISARQLLSSCASVSLRGLAQKKAEMPLQAEHVIRRRDLIDLFDTTPDLTGSDIDIARFIRSGDEHDVQAYWRDFAGTPDEAPPGRSELCTVPVSRFREFRKNHPDDVWRWDGLEEKWRKATDREIYPGQTYLVHVKAGGYEPEIGWSPKSDPVKPLPHGEGKPEGYSRDFEDGPWLTIADHTDDVVAELRDILSDLGIDTSEREVLEEAARWHDWGKAHEVFQRAVIEEDRPPDWVGNTSVGKAPGRFWDRRGYKHAGFRHELASALGMLHIGMTDLSAYLVAAHHGKVRLSIRSLPNETVPPEPERLFARGVWDGDALPSVSLGGGVVPPKTTLDLSCMQMGRSAEGGPSWAERMLRLRDRWGPFKLAYLETLLRAADMRASRNEARKCPEAQGE